MAHRATYPERAHVLDGAAAALTLGSPDAARLRVDRDTFAAALDVLNALANRWRVVLRPGLVGEPTCSLVVAGSRGRREVVLKLPLRGEERDSGYRAMLAFAGHGGVPVLEADDANAAVLMPRIAGPDLTSQPDDVATRIWCGLCERLAGAPAFAAMPVAEYIEPLTPLVAEFDDRVHVAVANAAAWLATEPWPVSRLQHLHGDLHHYNVLRYGNRWVAIDPKGLVGDPHFEATSLLRNPFPRLAAEPRLAELLDARIARVGRQLGRDVARLRAYALVQTYGCARSRANPWRQAMVRCVHALLALPDR